MPRPCRPCGRDSQVASWSSKKYAPPFALVHKVTSIRTGHIILCRKRLPSSALMQTAPPYATYVVRISPRRRSRNLTALGRSAATDPSNLSNIMPSPPPPPPTAAVARDRERQYTVYVSTLQAAETAAYHRPAFASACCEGKRRPDHFTRPYLHAARCRVLRNGYLPRPVSSWRF